MQRSGERVRVTVQPDKKRAADHLRVEEHGRSVLPKALSALRRDLGADDAYLNTNHDIRLNPKVVRSDLAELEAALVIQRAP